MKKYFLLILLLVVAGVFLFNFVRGKVRRDLAQPVTIPIISSEPTPKEKNVQGIRDEAIKRVLFVPYWSLGKDKISDADYDSYLYFGVLPGVDGINQDESGAKHLDDFLSAVPAGKEKFLVVRMTDNDNNFAVLKDVARQKKLITQALTLAKKDQFDGIVLDLEVSAIPFDSLVNQISAFTESFYKETKKNNLSFAMTMYGDTFFRLRPFDVKSLSAHADKIMLMAYDFSKSRGNPGPNFPLSGHDTYGYDLSKMSDDFLKYMPAEKIAVVFGIFGYDWTVDGKGNSLGSAKPLTDKEISKDFLTKCNFADCVIKKDTISAETKITYTDEENNKHIVWFEDMRSAAQKQEYLQGRGIGNFGYWAYSYF